LVLKAFKVQQETQALRVFRVLLALKAFKVQQATQALKAYKV
jgi:hypothetical protein